MRPTSAKRRSRPLPRFSLLLAVLLAGSALAQTEQVGFTPESREVVEERFGQLSHDLSDRQARLTAMFEQAGCPQFRLQPVKRLKNPNLICTIPGSGDSIIVVGAHFDLAELGMGAVDNWSGASLLPSLVQSLLRYPRRHSFVFVAFNGEEKGLVGSRFFVSQLSPQERAKVRAYVNLDCLGLGPLRIWLSRSDRRLADALVRLAAALKTDIGAVNVDRVASDDAASFLAEKIPIISLHSITQETFPVVHSMQDQPDAIKHDDYYATYRLLCGYLCYLDMMLE